MEDERSQDAPVSPPGKEPVLMLPWAFLYIVFWRILLWAQNPGLMTDDSGETVTAAWLLGVGHFPGYPLHTLLGRLAVLIPVGTPAFRLNLMASFYTMIAVIFVVETCRILWARLLPGVPRSLPAREAALFFVALSLLSCQSVFAQSLTAKGGIYTFTLMGLAVILWFIIREDKAIRPFWLLFFWSVGMGSHWQTQVLWLVLLAVYFHQKNMFKGFFAETRRMVAALSFVIIGLSTYLYLPLRSALFPALNWEEPRTFGAFWRVVSRSGAPAEEFTSRGMGDYLWNVREYLVAMGSHWWPGFVLLAVAGAWVLFRRDRPLALVLLSGYAALLAAILQVSHFTTVHSRYLEGIFLVSTQALPAVLGFAGLTWLYGRLKRSRPRVALAVVIALVLFTFGWGVWVFKRQQKSRYTLAEDYAANMFQELPENALVLLDSDVTIMPGLYFQNVGGKRRDVAMVPLPTLYSYWGFRQILAEYEGRVNVSCTVTGFQDALRFLTDPQRFRCSSVFYSYDKSILEDSRLEDLAERLFPWGLNYRLATAPPSPEEVSRDVWRTALHRRLRNLDQAVDLPATEFTYLVYRSNYARPHMAAGSLLLKKGLLYPAVRHYREAQSIDPGMVGIDLNLASYFATAGYLELAERFCREEARIAPDRVETHILHGNVLLMLGRWDQAAQEFERALRIDPNSSEARYRQGLALRYRQESPPPGWVRSRKAEDYAALGKEYEADGQDYLAGIATETARDLGASTTPAF